MSNNSQIFVSYSHDDEFFAHSLIDALKGKLIERDFRSSVVWMDTQQIFAGDDWVDKVEKAIKDSFVVLLVVSPAAMKSFNVNYEWAFAFGAGKVVIPIIYKDPGELPAKLRHRIQIKFKDDSLKLLGSLQWRELLDAVEKTYNDSNGSKSIQVSSILRQT